MDGIWCFFVGLGFCFQRHIVNYGEEKINGIKLFSYDLARHLHNSTPYPLPYYLLLPLPYPTKEQQPPTVHLGVALGEGWIIAIGPDVFLVQEIIDVGV